MDSHTQPQEDASMKFHYIVLAFTLTSAPAIAGNSTWDAAIGGGIGGLVTGLCLRDAGYHVEVF